jgi:hypothetical protein
MNKLPLLLASLVCSAVCSHAAIDAQTPIAALLKNPTKGDPALQSIGPLAFGPRGVLLVAEPGTPAIVAVDTGDTTSGAKLAQPIDDVAALVASAVKASAAEIQIVDLAVNPASGKTYLAVRNNAAKKVAIVTVDAAGKAAVLDLAGRSHIRVALPKSEAGPLRNISDLAMATDRVLVTGQSNEEFSSKIFSIPLPLDATAPGHIFSAETFHVAHGRWETKAPIQSFIPYEDRGELCVVGAFACTPIAKFPIGKLSAGANVRGTSVVELGSGNRPLDLFAYTKGGKSWIVTNTQRFKEPLYGPSKFWGVRVSTEYLDRHSPDDTNEKAVRRNVKATSGPEGIEIFDALSGAVQIDKLDDTTMFVLREAGDKLRLETAALP